MPPKPTGKTKKPSDAGGAKKKITAKGYQKAVKVPNGEILTDIAKQQWKVGPAIGSGGFGDIYSAQKVGDSSKDYSYVVKIEPHGNGPLFVERNFYLKAAKLADIEYFKKQRKLKSLGMPHYVNSGSHSLDNLHLRFVVMPRYGRDIWSFFLENGKKVPQPTIYRIAIQMLDVLEYIHHSGYVHADLKGANILLGHGKSGLGQVYLVDFGLASLYTSKDFKPDPKKMHNGTIEYTSRDAHNGVPTMRSDMEILAYNIVHWSGVTLPWEAAGLLGSPQKVQESKEKFMSNLPTSLKTCFPACPDVISNYLKYVATLKYNETPDYEKCRKMFDVALKQLGETNSGDLKFTMTASVGSNKKSTSKHSNVDNEAVSPMKKAPKKQQRLVYDSEDDDDDDDDAPSEDEYKPNEKSNSRKRVVVQQPTTSENVSSKRSKTPRSVTIDTQSSSLAKHGSTVINNDLTPKDKNKSKTYNFNIELDVSIDANIVINVQRKAKKDKIKNEKVTQVGSSKNGISDDDEDVIPKSNENTPFAKIRVSKNKIGTPRKTPKRSPRLVL